MQLKLLVRDSQRHAKRAMAEASRLVKRGCVGFIGPAQSGPATEVAALLAIPAMDRATIGYSSTSPELSADRFSNFLRTPPSDAVQARMMATLMKGLLVG